MKNRDRRRVGFTLMEVLLVLVILVVLGSLSVGLFTNTKKGADIKAAKAQISLLRGHIDRFQLDMGHTPNQLQDLWINPDGSSNWAGPYMDPVPPDPWGNPYNYSSSGTHNNEYDVYTTDPDGNQIGNWQSQAK